MVAIGIGSESSSLIKNNTNKLNSARRQYPDANVK